MTILVTGAAGFIGMHVCRALLDRGETVIGVDNLDPYYPVELKRDRLRTLGDAAGDRFEFVPVDIADDAGTAALARRDFDRIVHLAAQAGVRHSIDHPVAYVRANLVGHANILELARHRCPRHLVYASSSSVYGGNDRLPFAVEDRADRPLSLYAATKRADELMTEAYAHLYRLPATGLRFFTVYGPWGRPDMAMWLFTAAILQGEPVTLFGNGAPRRDFTYIDDIVAGVVAALDSPPPDDGAVKPGGSVAPHRLYNIGNNRPVTVDRLIGVIEEACGRTAIRRPAPLQPGDADATCADIAAISGDLGFAPRTPIEEGVPRFVRWFRDYHRL